MCIYVQSPDKCLQGNYILSIQQINTLCFISSIKAYIILAYYLSNIVTQFTNKKQTHHQQQRFIQLGNSLSKSRPVCPPTHSANRCRHASPYGTPALQYHQHWVLYAHPTIVWALHRITVTV